MAVYRRTGRAGPPPWLLVGATVLALALVAGLAWLVVRPAPVDDRTALKTDLTELLARLDVLTVEYPQQYAGGDAGGTSALRGARATFDRAQPRLARLDPPAARQMADALAALEQQVGANADPAQVTAQADALAAQARAWLRTH